MIEKVIFDTNKLRDNEPSHSSFFGNRSQLEKFFSVAEIIIPDIVIEELKRQKTRGLESKKDSFLANPMHWIMGISKDEITSFDIQGHIQKLQDEEEMKYKIIELTDFSILPKIKELAISKEAPFENGDNTDKGFKDAYIYFTILEYLETIPDKHIFVCTNDGRLKIALQTHPKITIIKDFSDFEDNSSLYFQTSYFIDKFKEKINGGGEGDWVSNSITKESIVNVRNNINGNRVVEIASEAPMFLAEVDFSTKEINDFIIEDIITEEDWALWDLIKNLIDSDSFDNTDYCIYHLTNLIQYLKDDEIIKLIEASISNNQIYRIAEKESLKNFFKPLFEYKKDVLDKDVVDRFIGYFGE